MRDNNWQKLVRTRRAVKQFWRVRKCLNILSLIVSIDSCHLETPLRREQISVQGCGGSGRWVALLCKVWRLWRDEQLTHELFLQIFAESCAGPGRRCWVCGVWAAPLPNVKIIISLMSSVFSPASRQDYYGPSLQTTVTQLAYTNRKLF